MDKYRRPTHSARDHDTTRRMDVAVDDSRLVALECREAGPVPRAPHVELRVLRPGHQMTALVKLQACDRAHVSHQGSNLGCGVGG
jgi:hypothetical protein